MRGSRDKGARSTLKAGAKHGVDSFNNLQQQQTKLCMAREGAK